VLHSTPLRLWLGLKRNLGELGWRYFCFDIDADLPCSNKTKRREKWRCIGTERKLERLEDSHSFCKSSRPHCYLLDSVASGGGIGSVMVTEWVMWNTAIRSHKNNSYLYYSTSISGITEGQECGKH
jgi:hypothetical protein